MVFVLIIRWLLISVDEISSQKWTKKLTILYVLVSYADQRLLNEVPTQPIPRVLQPRLIHTRLSASVSLFQLRNGAKMRQFAGTTFWQALSIPTTESLQSRWSGRWMIFLHETRSRNLRRLLSFERKAGVLHTVLIF
jgi:hypothetical protein